MLLVLNDIVSDSSSNSEGLKLFKALENAIEFNNEVILVVNNSSSLSSSFLNSSIGNFLETYGVDYFKQNVKISGSKTQFERISNYLKKFNSLYAC